jgi:hypothetical protein
MDAEFHAPSVMKEKAKAKMIYNALKDGFDDIVLHGDHTSS